MGKLKLKDRRKRIGGKVGRFKDRSLQERVFNFVIGVLKLVEKLPRNRRNMIVGNLLMRAATSTGANLTHLVRYS